MRNIEAYVNDFENFGRNMFGNKGFNFENHYYLLDRCNVPSVKECLLKTFEENKQKDKRGFYRFYKKNFIEEKKNLVQDYNLITREELEVLYHINEDDFDDCYSQYLLKKSTINSLKESIELNKNRLKQIERIIEDRLTLEGVEDGTLIKVIEGKRKDLKTKYDNLLEKIIIIKEKKNKDCNDINELLELKELKTNYKKIKYDLNTMNFNLCILEGAEYSELLKQYQTIEFIETILIEDIEKAKKDIKENLKKCRDNLLDKIRKAPEETSDHILEQYINDFNSQSDEIRGSKYLGSLYFYISFKYQGDKIGLLKCIDKMRKKKTLRSIEMTEENGEVKLRVKQRGDKYKTDIKRDCINTLSKLVKKETINFNFLTSLS